MSKGRRETFIARVKKTGEIKDFARGEAIVWFLLACLLFTLTLFPSITT